MGADGEVAVGLHVAVTSPATLSPVQQRPVEQREKGKLVMPRHCTAFSPNATGRTLPPAALGLGDGGGRVFQMWGGFLGVVEQVAGQTLEGGRNRGGLFHSLFLFALQCYLELSGEGISKEPHRVCWGFKGKNSPLS